jgi:hypothetical protein
MSTDQEWAHDLFERSRDGEEPAWVADHIAVMRAGRRRRTLAMAASGSAVAVLSVAAVVGVVALNDGAPKTHQPRPVPPGVPVTTATPMAADPAKVLDYVQFDSWRTKDNKSADGDYFKKYYIAVPESTARDTMQLLTRLDPAFSHITKRTTVPAADRDIRLVPDDDTIAGDMAMLGARVPWRGHGNLSLTFTDDADLVPGDPTGGCRSMDMQEAGVLDPVPVADNGWTEGAKIGPCDNSTLPDGSTLQSTSKSYGPYAVVYATRRFPGDTGAVELMWWNYDTTFTSPNGMSPDPKRVLSPNPITADKLKTVLSDTTLVPPLKSAPAAAPPATMLQASDFGRGWTYDAQQSHSTTGALVVDDGCTDQQNAVVTPQPMYTYTGTTPSGGKVTATIGVNVMQHNSGPGWMAELRKHGTGGCDQGDQKQLKYSQDTMTPLPGGIGDDAFVENWVGQNTETLFVRFGDDILRLDVATPNQTMPAFTQADKTWFAELASKAAARHGGKG